MAEDQVDHSFVAFEHPIYGIRALARTLLTYQEKHGLRTIRTMIHRWAPAVENNTDAYIEHLTKLVGTEADAPLILREQPHKFSLLVAGIIQHENGLMPYEKTVVDDGILLATAV